MISDAARQCDELTKAIEKMYAITESQEASNLPKCKEIAEYLAQAYPGHTWYIRIDGGCLIIKNLKIHDKAAMVRKLNTLYQDAERLKHDVVMAAGEFLECAGMRRRAYEGDHVTKLEGMKKGEVFKPRVIC